MPTIAYATLWRGMSAAPVVSFGIDNVADYRATELHECLKEAGFHVTYTLRAAAWAITRCGSMWAAATTSTTRWPPRRPPAQRARRWSMSSRASVPCSRLQAACNPGRTKQGARLIDDSYNANPSSMRAGIDVLVGLGGRPWLVMGDMGELGDHARSSHVEIGRYARERGVQRMFATGPLSMLAVESFGAGATWYPDTDALARAVNEELTADVSLLVKGSRSNRLERVVAKLTGAAGREVH